MLTYNPVALDFMNHDHADFAATHDALLTALAATDSAQVDELLKHLLTHTRDHFAAEETAMQQANFPPYPMHKMEHDKVLAVFQQQADNWQNQRDAASLQKFLAEDVAQWFVQHVNMMDFVTARYIAQAQAQ